MRKWLLALALLLTVAVVSYFLLPGAGPVARYAFIDANQKAVYRCLTNKNLFEKWWPGGPVALTPDGKNLVATYNDLQFAVTAQAFDAVRIDIKEGATPVQSFITVFSLQQDSSAITWKAELPQRSGLFARLQNPLLPRKLKQSMEGVLEHLQVFMKNEKNIYGIAIAHERVTDTLLVSIRQRDTIRPTVETYYGLIKKLQAYITTQGAQQTNYPMLNIWKADSLHYETMVAIPVNKRLPDNSTILAKQMVPGHILIAEVKGGISTVEEGFRQLDFYANEHRLTQPGLPFQSLVTDRLAEPDTAKWVTRLYYPVL